MSLQQELEEVILTVPDFPKKGVSFKDINPLFKNPVVMKKVIQEMAIYAKEVKAQHIVGIESRGFFFGIPLALELNIPFVAARKKGKLPGDVISQEYLLEYGTDCIEIQKNSILINEKYLIVDDVIATGGTAKATAEIIKKGGAEVCGFSFLIELLFLNGKNLILPSSSNIQSLLKYS
ncbi:adenine phosphoribosyltransferase [Pigmentibacter sp. JX0631]|uniref:adenine phosphoribosyltransferase n=1 Tax=Pigmentibacter sp. JX0631 TaxID=2976982 RepID=UPI002468A936|nr:adenine phosphoribosyltransferase [Pigmentibacter sp. JX0631]WGL59671.1 adenine phosphoribosyltransferase [Pigmentibacter sp. JX0631]